MDFISRGMILTTSVDSSWICLWNISGLGQTNFDQVFITTCFIWFWQHNAQTRNDSRRYANSTIVLFAYLHNCIFLVKGITISRPKLKLCHVEELVQLEIYTFHFLLFIFDEINNWHLRQKIISTARMCFSCFGRWS